MPALFPAARARLNDNPYLLLILTALMWAGNIIASRACVGELSPMTVICMRWFVVCTVLATIVPARFVQEWPGVKASWRRLALLGGTGFTIFNALFYTAAHYTSGVNMAVLQGSFPAFVLVGAALLFGTRLRVAQCLGAGATIIGVLVVSTRGDVGTLLAFAFNRGDLMMLVATVIYAAYTLALRDRPKLSPLVMFAVLSLAAFLTSLPLLAIEIAAGASQAPTLKGVAVLLYIALGPSLVAQLFYIRSVELIGPARAGVFYNLVPVFGATLSVLLLGESFHLYHAVGFVLVIGGIVLAESRRPA